jgi:putative membrane protein
MDHITGKSPTAAVSTELASRRTGLSLQRTRMSADRTLMSIIRTALSLISFGFTIYQFLGKLAQAGVGEMAASARNFGVALVVLGIAMLTGGIAVHLQYMASLRRERALLIASGLLSPESVFPLSLTLVTAVLLLALGFMAVLSMAFQIGPFR